MLCIKVADDVYMSGWTSVLQFSWNSTILQIDGTIAVMLDSNSLHFVTLFQRTLVKAGTDLCAAAVMQHETCIRAHVRGYNCHPKQLLTIDKLRTNQMFELHNEQARHWSDCICILTATLYNKLPKSTNINLRSHYATNASQLRSESLCVWRKNRQKVVRCTVRSIAAVCSCNPPIFHEHGWNHARFALRCCRDAQVCTSLYMM